MIIHKIFEGDTFKDRCTLFFSLFTKPFTKRLLNDVVVRTRYGKVIRNRFEYSYRKDRPDPLLDFFSTVHGNVVDVGANVGKYSLMSVKDNDGYVFAFEPDKRAYNLLVKHITMNDAYRVYPFKSAVGDENGRKIFYYNDDAPVQGTGSLKQDTRYHRDITSVDCVRLDDIKSLRDIRVLKIDTEGTELDVLRGASRLIERDRPIIIYEALDDEKVIKIRNHLNAMGYIVEPFDDENFIARYG